MQINWKKKKRSKIWKILLEYFSKRRLQHKNSFFKSKQGNWMMLEKKNQPEFSNVKKRRQTRHHKQQQQQQKKMVIIIMKCGRWVWLTATATALQGERGEKPWSTEARVRNATAPSDTCRLNVPPVPWRRSVGGASQRQRQREAKGEAQRSG